MPHAYPTPSRRVPFVIQEEPNLVHAHDTPGATTGSTSRVMAGLGILFTPKWTGRAKFHLIAYVSNSTTGDGTLVQPAYGTGTAPSAGDAATGTTFSATKQGQPVAAGGFMDFSFIDYITGLTIGTQYWFDIQAAVITGGTATLEDFEVLIEEY